jgi:hypothetical protein
LSVRQPSSLNERAAASSSSSWYSFWITSRSRCVPASGASVKPVFRTRRISSRMRGDSASTRVEGRDTATRSGASRSISAFSTGLTPL